MKEEYLRESLPSDLGIALNKESGRREPAIVLRQPLKDKENLKFRDVESSWTVAQNAGRVEMLFLTINFKAKGGKEAALIRIFISKFDAEVMDWFRLLISTKGEMVLNDSLGDVQAIIVTGVPLFNFSSLSLYIIEG
jgi:hypothetical protein